MSYDQTQVAFVDTETLGLDPEHHKIWEIAVIADGVEHCWQQRFTAFWPADPDMTFWLEATGSDGWVVENTGIMERFDFFTAMPPLPSLIRFIELTRGRHLVGACPWFDSERLHRLLLSYERSGEGRNMPWHYHLIDIENLAVGYLKGMQDGSDDYHDEFTTGGFDTLPWKSADLSRAIGVDPDEFQPKHTALADARWAKAVYEKIMGGPK